MTKCIILTAHSLEEWREHVIEFNRLIREFRVPLSITASGTPEVLEEGDARVPGAGFLMAFGYGNYSEAAKGFNRPTHQVSLRSECAIPGDDKWITDSIRRALLREGHLVSPQMGDEITHLFHIGRHPTPGMGWLSFGAQMTDDDAISSLIRDFGGVECLKIPEGVYLGMDHHP